MSMSEPTIVLEGPSSAISGSKHALSVPVPAHSKKDSDPEISLVNVNVTTYEILPPPQPMLVDEPEKPATMTLRDPSRNIWRLLAICVWMFTTGSADSIPGAILPTVEAKYNLTYTLVSMIWLGNALGFMIVACSTHWLEKWLNLLTSLVLGSMFSVGMYSIVLSGTLFPIIVLGFVVGGVGIALALSKINIFLSRLGDKLSKYLSVTQASYGIGATIAPIVATSLVNAGVKWNYIYLFLLGLMLTVFGLFFHAFKGADQDMRRFEKDDTEDTEADQKSNLRYAVHNKLTWLFAFFVFFYQGSEVSIGGWIVTYLLEYRNGGTSVGYVASGFWGGVSVGRMFVARPLHKALGARRSVTVCSLCALVCVALTWAIPTLISAGVFVSLCGVFVGPAYPIMVSLAADLLPRKIQNISLTIATAFGSAGGAFFPFLVGIVSQKLGAFVVLPGFLILYSIMLCLWLSLPNRERTLKGELDLNLWQRFW